jgi:hypothetical protein
LLDLLLPLRVSSLVYPSTWDPLLPDGYSIAFFSTLLKYHLLKGAFPI